MILGQFTSSTENLALYLSGTAVVFEDKTSDSTSGRYVITASGSISASTWQHVAVVKNGSTAKIYVNGVEKGTASLSAGTAFTTNLEIGAQNGGTAYEYGGSIDEIRIS